MATHKSAVKAHKRSEANAARNTSILSRIKTFVKKVEKFLSEGKQDEAEKALRSAESEIMKGVSKKVIKKNAGSRKVSRLTKKVKSNSGAKPAAKTAAKSKASKAKVTKAKPAASKTTKSKATKAKASKK